MANLEGGNFDKFLVIKREYIDSPHGNFYEKELIKVAKLNRIVATRKTDSPKYLVINTDEPYADEVITILKRNGHWG